MNALALFVLVLCVVPLFAQQTYFDVTPGNGYGLRFWQMDAYKIHMGNSTEYRYGPVSDYSIKMNMSPDVGRGWTWGLSGVAPIAALGNTGNMQLAGTFTLGANSAPLNFTTVWGGSPDNATNVSEISNDASAYRQLMIVGNKAQGADRRVGIWDRLSINGAGFNQTLNVNGRGFFSDAVGIGTSSPSTLLHLQSSSSNAYITLDKPNSNTEGGIVFSNSSAPIFFLFSDNSDNDALKIETSGLAGENDSTPRMEFPKLNKNIYMVESGGNVGIGTTSPSNKLHLKSSSAVDRISIQGTLPNSNVGFTIMNQDGTERWSMASTYDRNSLQFWRAGYGNVMVLLDNGNIGVGTSVPNEKLTVNGTVYGKEVRVDLAVPAPDYVFRTDYRLPALDEVREYLESYGHLPEVPSGKTMERDGLELGKMNMILLKKIEELTLYIIELKKENASVRNELLAKITALERVVEDMDK